MGNASSKAARKFPTKAKLPPTSSLQNYPPPPELLPKGPPGAEGHKSQAIKEDAADPHFLANLSRLGPVLVDHHMKTYQTEANQTKQLFENRAKTESEASSRQLQKNHLYAASLSELLDKRKDVRTKEDVERLAKEYGLDVGRLENLVKFVNSPSVDSLRIRSASEKNEEDEMMLPAIWIEPSYQKAA